MYCTFQPPKYVTSMVRNDVNKASSIMPQRSFYSSAGQMGVCRRGHTSELMVFAAMTVPTK